MTSVRDAFESMAWGTAPESAALAKEWLDRHGRRFGQYINGEWTAPGETFVVTNPATGGELAQVTQATDADVTQRWRRRARRCPGGRRLGGHGRARWLYAHCARDAAQRAPLLGGREPRQRQADPRVARHRYPAGRPALLSPCRLGAAARPRVSGDGGGGRGGAGHPLEFPAADDGVEDRAGYCGG